MSELVTGFIWLISYLDLVRNYICCLAVKQYWSYAPKTFSICEKNMVNMSIDIVEIL